MFRSTLNTIECFAIYLTSKVMEIYVYTFQKSCRNKVFNYCVWG